MISSIILAAGESKRFGEPKQLYKIDNDTLIEKVLKLTLIFFDEVIVVLGYKKELVLPLISSNNKVKIVINENYKKGMSESLKAGVYHISEDATHFAIFLVDMPYIKKETIELLLQDLRQGKREIIAPFYKGRRGFPVFFSRDFLKDVKNITGDKGARDIIKENLQFLRAVEVNDPGVVMDIDTKKDIKIFKFS